MTNYARLDTMIKATVMSNKKIAICPFAEEGMRAKEILNLRYGIEETFIIDNRLAEINPNIITINDLKTKNTDNLVILLTISNREVNQVLQNQINDLRMNIEIQNCLGPIWMHVPDKKEYFKQLKERLYVKALPDDIKMVRVGKDSDGGYCLADDFNEKMKVYSFGVGPDVSFDKQLAEKGLNIYLYDHTVTGLPSSHEKFSFFKTGISDIDEIDNNKLSLSTILEMNGHLDNKGLILKMDVEGMEWEVIRSTPSEILKHFRQISLELHHVTNEKRAKDILGVLDKLNETHQLIWVHGNNFAQMEDAGGISIPAYMEVTYVNRSCYKCVDRPCYFPTEIDRPDYLAGKEIILGNWGKQG